MFLRPWEWAVVNKSISFLKSKLCFNRMEFLISLTLHTFKGLYKTVKIIINIAFMSPLVTKCSYSWNTLEFIFLKKRSLYINFVLGAILKIEEKDLIYFAWPQMMLDLPIYLDKMCRIKCHKILKRDSLDPKNLKRQDLTKMSRFSCVLSNLFCDFVFDTFKLVAWIDAGKIFYFQYRYDWGSLQLITCPCLVTEDCTMLPVHGYRCWQHVKKKFEKQKRCSIICGA